MVRLQRSPYLAGEIMRGRTLTVGDVLERSLGEGGMEYWRVYGAKILESRTTGNVYLWKAKLRKYTKRPEAFLTYEGVEIAFQDVEKPALWMKKDGR